MTAYITGYIVRNAGALTENAGKALQDEATVETIFNVFRWTEDCRLRSKAFMAAARGEW